MPSEAEYLREKLLSIPPAEREQYVFQYICMLAGSIYGWQSLSQLDRWSQFLVSYRTAQCLGITQNPESPIAQPDSKQTEKLQQIILSLPPDFQKSIIIKAIINEYCTNPNNPIIPGTERNERIFNWIKYAGDRPILDLGMDVADRFHWFKLGGDEAKLQLGINATHKQIDDYASYLAFICKSFPNEKYLKQYAQKHGVILGPKQKLSRLIDRKFWRKILFKEIRRRREYLYMKFLPQKLKWCSDLGLMDSLQTNMESAEWLANHQAVSDAGDVLNFPSLPEIAKRNQARMFRTAEFISKKAADAGAKHAVAFTITLPSRFHPSTTAGGSRVPNPKWDRSNPRDGKAFFDTQWVAFTKQCKRLEVINDYIMATEPHEDETPHWHGVMWTNKPDELKRLIIQYFYEKAEPDGGTAEIRVKINTLESSGAALAYASKTLSYISKHQGADKTDKRFKEEAERSQAWARAWGMRRLRKSGVGVTLYEYLRRLDKEAMPDGEARAIIEAAKKGDMYGALKPGRFKFNYVEAKNIYDEDVRRIDGIKDLSGDKIIRKTRYTIVGKKYKEPTDNNNIHTPPTGEKALRAKDKRPEATAKEQTEANFQELQKRILGNVRIRRLHQGEQKENYPSAMDDYFQPLTEREKRNLLYNSRIIDYFRPLTEEDFEVPDRRLCLDVGSTASIRGDTS